MKGPEVTDVLAVLDRLGPALLVTRTLRGLSLREVARQTGESASTVMRVENGQDCNLSTARALLAWIGQEADR
jgi:transcriptional regulator with XRE-family HTH domain